MVIIEIDLVDWQVESLVSILKRFKKSIGWSIADIIGILLGIFKYKIQLERDCVPTIEHQQRLNPPMHTIIKK